MARLPVIIFFIFVFLLVDTMRSVVLNNRCCRDDLKPLGWAFSVYLPVFELRSL